MSEEKQAESTRQVLLNNDQFEISEQGEVVIKSREVAEAIQSQLVEANPTEAGSIRIDTKVNI